MRRWRSSGHERTLVQRLGQCAVACAALAAGLALAGALGSAGAAAPSIARVGRLPVWPSLKAKRIGRLETGLVYQLTTKPGARCSLVIAAGRERLTLPTLIASNGQAAWGWSTLPGAPSGTWRIIASCLANGQRGSATLRPLVLVPAGRSRASVVAPNSLTIQAGRPLRPFAREAPQTPKRPVSGRGAGTSSNPFWDAKGYCTWGAWENAQWLGSAVLGIPGRTTGDAKWWATNAAARGLPTGTTPVVGAVFVKTSPGIGHVGLVTGSADVSGRFPTMEMNGGSRWTDPGNYKTNEFGQWKAHSQLTGPNMFFIYKPGTQPGAAFNPAAYDGHIVKQDNGSPTSWLVVDAQGHRNWIPTGSIYNCLIAQGHPVDTLSADKLNKLPDQKDVWATCSAPSPPSGSNPQPGGGNPQPGGSNPQPGGSNPQTSPATTIIVVTTPTPTTTTAPTTTPTSPPPTTTPSSPGVTSLTSGPSISPNGGNPGTTSTYSYSIKNTGGSALTLKVIFVAVRAPDGSNIDTSCSGGTNVTLAAGASFSCSATGTYNTAGTYTWWADWEGTDGAFHQLSGNTTFTINAPAPPPPSPTVSANKGPQHNISGCTSSACAYLTVNWANFGSGGHTIVCYGDYGGASSFYSYSVSGPSGSSNVCVFGYPGYHAWATVDGHETNHVTW